MKSRTNDELSQLIVHLDGAIAQSIENPLLLVDRHFLVALDSSCASLRHLSDDVSIPGQGLEAREVQERTALLWQVRARAGRFQMLLDTAARFYSSCFSTSQPDGLAYGVHGEWSAMVTPSHLAVDC